MTVTTNEVAKVIRGLKRGKAVGPDNVVLFTWSVLLGYTDTWSFGTWFDGHTDYTISKKQMW